MPFWPPKKAPPQDQPPYFWRKKSPFSGYERLTRDTGGLIKDGDAQALKLADSWQLERSHREEGAHFSFVAGELYCLTSDPEYDPNFTRRDRYMPVGSLKGEAALLKSLEVFAHLDEGSSRP